MLTNLLSDFIYLILPYITITIFLLASIYKVILWFRIPMEIKWPLSPAPTRKIGAVTYILKELVTLEGHFKADSVYWLIVILFHISILSIIPHIITFLSGSYLIIDPLFMSLGAELYLFVKWLTLWYSIAGIIAATTILLILLRRLLIREVRQISLLRDYLELIVLLLIIMLGTYMHMFNLVPSGEILKYFSSLALLNPIRPPQNLIFTLHYVLAQLYLIYFPFGKCFHIIGYLVNNWIVRQGVK